MLSVNKLYAASRSFSVSVPGFNGNVITPKVYKDNYGVNQKLNNVAIKPAKDELDFMLLKYFKNGETKPASAYSPIIDGGNYTISGGISTSNLENNVYYALKISSKLHYVSNTKVSGIHNAN